MTTAIRLVRPFAALLALAAAGAAAGGVAPLEVVDHAPTKNGAAATTSPLISIRFDRALDPATVGPSSVRVFGKWTGVVAAPPTLADGDVEIRIHPERPLSAGDVVTVQLSNALRAADGGAIRAAGYAFQFMAPVAGGTLTFVPTQDITTNRPGESSRPYGGVATDVNEDGWPDVTLTNEDTADLRVFLNRADGTVRTTTFLEPTTPLGFGASPSDVADLNGDGHVDLVVTCNQSDTVEVLHGDGTGAFTVMQTFAIAGTPRGVAVFDCDGDGDDDAFCANDATGRIMRFVNDGTGQFAPPVSFDTPAQGERALAAGDFDEDGILDLVCGDIGGSRMLVLRGSGNGLFTTVADVPSVGASWMVMPGDLNGDGHLDVTSVNGWSNTASVLLGDGAGGLSAPATYFPDSFPLATDLGDLDGDGDLDWVVSSYNGDFSVWRNDGTGTFAFDQEFDAPSNASCALLADFDRDGDLDVALIDEIVDRLMLRRNEGSAPVGDLDGDGIVGFTDLVALLAAWGPCPGCPADLDGDGEVTFDDLVALLANWS